MISDSKNQILDIFVTFVLAIIACAIGSYVMTHVSDAWLGFNVPALGVFILCELVWWKIRKKFN